MSQGTGGSAMLDDKNGKSIDGSIAPTLRKANGKPWYIINSEENTVLNLFRIAMGIVAVPSVICNLFL